MSNVGSRRSRHVLLYGPPAAGKLTVAKLLTADYGMHLLDNHVSLDPARRLFDFGDARLAPVVEAIRITLLSAAARAGLDVVSTLVFAHPIDRDHVTRLREASEFCGAEVSFVQLVANPEVLARRVGMPSRGTNKITDAAQLHRMLDRYDLATPIHASDLSIDTTHRRPSEVVGEIAEHLGLRNHMGTANAPASG